MQLACRQAGLRLSWFDTTENGNGGWTGTTKFAQCFECRAIFVVRLLYSSLLRFR